MSSSFPINQDYPSAPEGGCKDPKANNYDPNAPTCCDSLDCCSYDTPTLTASPSVTITSTPDPFFYWIESCEGSFPSFYGTFAAGSAEVGDTLKLKGSFWLTSTLLDGKDSCAKITNFTDNIFGAQSVPMEGEYEHVSSCDDSACPDPLYYKLADCSGEIPDHWIESRFFRKNEVSVGSVVSIDTNPGSACMRIDSFKDRVSPSEKASMLWVGQTAVFPNRQPRIDLVDECEKYPCLKATYFIMKDCSGVELSYAWWLGESPSFKVGDVLSITDPTAIDLIGLNCAVISEKIDGATFNSSGRVFRDLEREVSIVGDCNSLQCMTPTVTTSPSPSLTATETITPTLYSLIEKCDPFVENHLGNSRILAYWNNGEQEGEIYRNIDYGICYKVISVTDSPALGGSQNNFALDQYSYMNESEFSLQGSDDFCWILIKQCEVFDQNHLGNDRVLAYYWNGEEVGDVYTHESGICYEVLELTNDPVVSGGGSNYALNQNDFFYTHGDHKSPPSESCCKNLSTSDFNIKENILNQLLDPNFDAGCSFRYFKFTAIPTGCSELYGQTTYEFKSLIDVKSLMESGELSNYFRFLNTCWEIDFNTYAEVDFCVDKNWYENTSLREFLDNTSEIKSDFCPAGGDPCCLTQCDSHCDAMEQPASGTSGVQVTSLIEGSDWNNCDDLDAIWLDYYSEVNDPCHYTTGGLKQSCLDEYNSAIHYWKGVNGGVADLMLCCNPGTPTITNSPTITQTKTQTPTETHTTKRCVRVTDCLKAESKTHYADTSEDPGLYKAIRNTSGIPLPNTFDECWHISDEFNCPTEGDIGLGWAPNHPNSANWKSDPAWHGPFPDLICEDCVSTPTITESPTPSKVIYEVRECKFNVQHFVTGDGFELGLTFIPPEPDPNQQNTEYLPVDCYVVTDVIPFDPDLKTFDLSSYAIVSGCDTYPCEPTNTITETPSSSLTETLTATETETATKTETKTETATETETGSPTATLTATETPTYRNKVVEYFRCGNPTSKILFYFVEDETHVSRKSHTIYDRMSRTCWQSSRTDLDQHDFFEDEVPGADVNHFFPSMAIDNCVNDLCYRYRELIPCDEGRDTIYVKDSRNISNSFYEGKTMLTGISSIPNSGGCYKVGKRISSEVLGGRDKYELDTNSIVVLNSASCSDFPCKTPTPKETPTLTETPKETPTLTETPKETPTLTETPTGSPTATESPSETATATETKTDEYKVFRFSSCDNEELSACGESPYGPNRDILISTKRLAAEFGGPFIPSGNALVDPTFVGAPDPNLKKHKLCYYLSDIIYNQKIYNDPKSNEATKKNFQFGDYECANNSSSSCSMYVTFVPACSILPKDDPKARKPFQWFYQGIINYTPGGLVYVNPEQHQKEMGVKAGCYRMSSVQKGFFPVNADGDLYLNRADMGCLATDPVVDCGDFPCSTPSITETPTGTLTQTETATPPCEFEGEPKIYNVHHTTVNVCAAYLVRKVPNAIEKAIKVTDKIRGLEIFKFLSSETKAAYKFIGNFDPFINAATGVDHIIPVKVKKTQACWINEFIHPQTGQLSGFYSPEPIEEKEARVEFDISSNDAMLLLTDNGANPPPTPLPDYTGYELQICLKVKASEKMPPIVSGFIGDRDSPDVLPYDTGGTASDPKKNEFTFINCYDRCKYYYSVREAGNPAIVGSANPNPHLNSDNKVIHFDNVAYVQTQNYSDRNSAQLIPGLREEVEEAIKYGSAPDTCNDCCETKQGIEDLCWLLPASDGSSSGSNADWASNYNSGWCSWEYFESQVANCELFKYWLADKPHGIIGGINIPNDINRDSCSVKIKSERFKYYYTTTTGASTLQSREDTCGKSTDCSKSKKKPSSGTCILKSSAVIFNELALEPDPPISTVDPVNEYYPVTGGNGVHHFLISSVDLKVPRTLPGVSYEAIKYDSKGNEETKMYFSGFEQSGFNSMLVKSKKACVITMLGPGLSASALANIPLPKNFNLGWGFSGGQVTSGPLGVGNPDFTLGDDGQGQSGGEFLKAISQTECLFSDISTSSTVFSKLLDIEGIHEDSSGVTFKSKSRANKQWANEGIPTLASVGVSGNNITANPTPLYMQIKCRFYLAEPLETKKCGEISDPKDIMVELELHDESLMSTLGLEAKKLVAGVLNNPPWKNLTINPVESSLHPVISYSEPISNMFEYNGTVYTIKDDPEPLRTRTEYENVGNPVNIATNVRKEDFVFRKEYNTGGAPLSINACANLKGVRITESSAPGNFIVVKAESTGLTRDRLIDATLDLINQDSLQNNPLIWWDNFLDHISQFYKYKQSNYSNWIYGYEYLKEVINTGPATHKLSAKLPYSLEMAQEAIFQDFCPPKGEQKWYNSKGEETDENFNLIPK